MERNPMLTPQEVLDEEALELRTMCLTYKQIGIQTRAHSSTAYRRTQRALERIDADCPEDPRMSYALQLLKLDRLERRMLKDGLNGDKGAVRLVLQIMDRRMKFLSSDTAKLKWTPPPPYPCEIPVETREDLEMVDKLFQPLMAQALAKYRGLAAGAEGTEPAAGAEGPEFPHGQPEGPGGPAGQEGQEFFHGQAEGNDLSAALLASLEPAGPEVFEDYAEFEEPPTATQGNRPQQDATPCNMPQQDATPCNMPQQDATQCNVPQQDATAEEPADDSPEALEAERLWAKEEAAKWLAKQDQTRPADFILAGLKRVAEEKAIADASSIHVIKVPRLRRGGPYPV